MSERTGLLPFLYSGLPSTHVTQGTSIGDKMAPADSPAYIPVSD